MLHHGGSPGAPRALLIAATCGLEPMGKPAADAASVVVSHSRYMPIFTVRVDAESVGEVCADDLQAMTEALIDFRGTVGLDPSPGRWSVTLVVSAATIEAAGNDGVSLVVDAGNAVHLPSSEITRLDVISAAECYRRAVTGQVRQD